VWSWLSRASIRSHRHSFGHLAAFELRGVLLHGLTSILASLGEDYDDLVYGLLLVRVGEFHVTNGNSAMPP